MRRSHRWLEQEPNNDCHGFEPPSFLSLKIFLRGNCRAMSNQPKMCKFFNLSPIFKCNVESHIVETLLVEINISETLHMKDMFISSLKWHLSFTRPLKWEINKLVFFVEIIVWKSGIKSAWRHRLLDFSLCITKNLHNPLIIVGEWCRFHWLARHWKDINRTQTRTWGDECTRIRGLFLHR